MPNVPWGFDEDEDDFDDDELDQFEDMDDFLLVNDHSPELFSSYRRQSLAATLLNAVYGAINNGRTRREEIIDLRNISAQEEVVTIMSDDENNDNNMEGSSKRNNTRRQQRGHSLFETAAMRARRQESSQQEPEFLNLTDEVDGDLSLQTTVTSRHTSQLKHTSLTW